MAAQLTLGPNLFHWTADQKLDFYNRIADESPVSTVYLGEVICSKRTPFFDDHHLDTVADRLERAGKTVVFCSFSEVVIKRERNILMDWSKQEGRDLEVNNTAALLHLKDRPHRIGNLLATRSAAHGAAHTVSGVQQLVDDVLGDIAGRTGHDDCSARRHSSSPSRSPHLRGPNP